MNSPLSIFCILSGLFILSMFYRVSNAVIAPELIQDFGLNAETLGILGGAYFYSFALLQIPMGPLLDRLGPRIIIPSFALAGAVGAFLFAFGESFPIALSGRILIGVGMSCVLMGAMKVFTLSFPSQKFATLVGLFISVGTLGSILATSPLAYLTSTIGWRTTFILAGAITTLFSLLVLWVLRGATREGPHPPKAEIGILQLARLVLGSMAFWQISSVAFFRYGTFIALQGLWLGPYLMESKGYSPILTGNLLILMAIGTILGGPIAGRLSDRTFRSRKSIALWVLSLYGLSLFPLAGLIRIEGPFWYGLIFFCLGFFSGGGMVIYSHAIALFPAGISGTVTAWINFYTMAGGAILMPVMGKIIESFPRSNHSYPPEAYHTGFLICFLGMAASILFYAFSKREKTQSPLV
jgi:sugar phosphate permease